MTALRTPQKPTFFWQGLLILLPVAVLAVVGMMSLRQDKVLAQHDAAERAQVIADDLAAKIWTELMANSPNPFNQRAFQVDEAGRLVFPPPYSPVPTPHPFYPAELNAEQARLWATLQAADAGTQKPEVLDRACKEFIDSNPPENFAAAASYGQGLRLMQQGKLLEAAEALSLVTEKYTNALGESGLPLWSLAQLKLFEILPHPQGPSRYLTYSRVSVPRNDINPVLLSFSVKHFVPLDTLCSNLVYHPTLLSPFLLGCIEGDLSRPEEMLPQTYRHEQLQKREEYETVQGVRLRPPRSDAQLIEDQEFGQWQRRWQGFETVRQLYSAAREHFCAQANPARPLFPLLSTSANAGNQTAGDETLRRGTGTTEATISFPRLFWFATPDFLCVPKVPGSNAEVAQNTYRSFVVAARASGSIWSSNATSIVARSMAGGSTLDRDWLAIGFEDHETNHWYFCRGESEIGSLLIGSENEKQQIPEYFGVEIQVANRKMTGAFAPDLRVWHYVGWYNPHSPGGGERKDYFGRVSTNILASAVKSEAGTELLAVNVYLTSPETLYRRQGARVFWFGSLVAAATVAALIGLWTAWRTFRQQRRLGELKSNFVSSVSHELRAPIASVRLMAENLEGGKIPEPQKQKEYFGFIVQECRRLSALIENVLDFSRIEQGRKQYEFEPTDVVALVQGTVRLMEPYAAEKGVALKLETSNIERRTSNIELKVDGRAIQQALVNLIDNAVKHSPKGETVTVGIEYTPESRAGVPPAQRAREREQVPPVDSPRFARRTGETPILLYVSDHGPGIPPEEQKKIFERFYRRGSELRRETQGVGIGLSIVKHIVEAHGGRVLVQSEPGKGSRFVIEIPILNETSNIER